MKSNDIISFSNSDIMSYMIFPECFFFPIKYEYAAENGKQKCTTTCIVLFTPLVPMIF